MPTILRATGKGYQCHDLDLESRRFTAVYAISPHRPRIEGALRPSALKGDLHAAFREAMEAWDGHVFGAPPPTGVEVEVRAHATLKSGWVARLVSGPDNTLLREFLDPAEDRCSRSGTGYRTYRLDPGVYESDRVVSSSRGETERKYLIVREGEAIEINRLEALGAIGIDLVAFEAAAAERRATRSAARAAASAVPTSPEEDREARLQRQAAEIRSFAQRARQIFGDRPRSFRVHLWRRDGDSRVFIGGGYRDNLVTYWHTGNARVSPGKIEVTDLCLEKVKALHGITTVEATALIRDFAVAVCDRWKEVLIEVSPDNAPLLGEASPSHGRDARGSG